MGYISPMIETLRVPMSKFKYNMKPFIDSAAKGETVIVTSNGKDKFKIAPCDVKRPRPLPKGCVKWENEDSNEPAFPP